jgi:excisionase family DNA binding protein
MDYLTVEEVAARLNVTSLTVRRWLQSGSLGGIAVDDRVACRIGVKDLEAFIDARRRGGVQERGKRRPETS